MKKTLLFAAALVFATVASMQGQPPGDKKADSREDSIKQLELARQEAFKKGDVDALDKGTADDYTSITSNGGTSTKARMLDRLKSGSFKMRDISLSDLKARIYGNTAVLTGRAHEVSEIDGKPKDQTYLFTRVFVKNHGRWQAVSYQQTPSPAN